MVEVTSILQFVSYTLSSIIIFLCLFLKLPQINRIYQRKTVVGLNFYSILFEICSTSFTACYNFVNKYAFMSYMEYPVIILQQLVIMILYLKYSSQLNFQSLFYFIVYVATLISICQEIIPRNSLDTCMILSTPVSLSSKVLQLWEIWRLKSADSISLTTWALSAFTNYARIYTVLLDSADSVLLTNFTVSGSLSLCIMLSARYLQNKKLHSI